MGRLRMYQSPIKQPLLSQANVNRALRAVNPGRCLQGMLAIATASFFLAAESLTESTALAARSPLTRSAAIENLVAPSLVAQATYPTLSAESTGASVSRLQATLKLLGFYQGAVDGTYGQATQAAVMRFQSAAGITADGVAGPLTWAKLLPPPDEITAISTRAGSVSEAPDPAPSASGPPVLRLNAEGSAVAQLQRELQTLGYYDGAVDGVYGEQTQAAVTQFQTDQKLTVDGIVGASTWDALTQALAQPTE
ncbi:MAG: peptidoglycan-binding domain-containing protein [Phormidesmis sp.]